MQPTRASAASPECRLRRPLNNSARAPAAPAQRPPSAIERDRAHGEANPDLMTGTLLRPTFSKRSYRRSLERITCGTESSDGLFTSFGILKLYLNY
ncbi:hypothetical protein EVAR_20012_1 [Eumeta japonica]|uniref:Uncharacterized protein n=1 Tax=Eumeta variegata TaxID=151549 RepID=A0A4C1VAY1_EUMVA|nr:hypothetical protein EVAR_20012_1 [Eumeta japonica]